MAWAGTAAQRLLACDLGLPPERLQLAATPDGEITVTAVVESFARLRALHARIMDEPAMTQWLARTGYALEWVQRRGAEYVARPPPLQQDPACSNGGRFYLRGEWVAPPPHGTTTPDCYGFYCQEGFEQAGQDCIPALANNSVFWGSVLLILILIVTVLLTACFVRVAPDAPEAPAKEEEEPPLNPFRNALPVAVEVVDGVEALVFEEEDDEDNEEPDDEPDDDEDEQDDDDDSGEDEESEPNL